MINQQEKKLVVKEKYNGLRLDKYLSLVLKGTSRTYIQELIKKKKVTLNLEFKQASCKVKPQDLVAITLVEKRPAEISLSPQDLKIIYQDQDLIVVDKPCGLIVHPAGKDKDSLIGALLAKGHRLSSISSSRPGVVHRLDKATSGVMVLAKNNHTHLYLVDEFKKRNIEKEYLALVKGILKTKKGKIDLPLKRLKYKPKMKVSFFGSKESLTYYEVLKEKGNMSLVRLMPKTGRMHQLRVHLSFSGYPIVGDEKYNGAPAERLFLHALKLGFVHPRTKSYVEFISRLPCDFKDYLNKQIFS